MDKKAARSLQAVGRIWNGARLEDELGLELDQPGSAHRTADGSGVVGREMAELKRVVPS